MKKSHIIPLITGFPLNDNDDVGRCQLEIISKHVIDSIGDELISTGLTWQAVLSLRVFHKQTIAAQACVLDGKYISYKSISYIQGVPKNGDIFSSQMYKTELRPPL